jgi:hypothetical protein
VQAAAAVQDTPLSTLLAAPGTPGVAWIAQLVPFHTSTSAVVGLSPGLVANSPTAVQAVEAPQDTPYSRLLVAPEGLGVVWVAHLLPFQNSANVCCTPLALMK